MGVERKITILVVDDHPFLREGIVGAINNQSDMVIVGEASNGEQSLTRAHELTPDVVLLDVHLPGGGGVEVMRRR